ncbi:MAG TPA: serine/threonine-protein kinase, partial [Kofleriaceae bacterium]|nr:serine/threonine-protein kinase [Kofleriaceae bacterium]
MGLAGATEKYRLGERIGGGGMAEVFEATLVGVAGFERPVAVKRMLPALSNDATFGAMFVNEARIASLLHHANIVTVLDFDRDGEGRFFLVMELIRGLDLRQLVDSGLLPIEVSVHIACEILRGLDYAHELEHEGKRLGIVHRDISPHNVMISWDGQVKLVDFGIAKAVAATGVSRSGTLKGKLAYMSPEQAGALELDGRSDVFAVGVVLHELLTGERLFRGSTEPEVLARVLTQPIPRPGELRPGVPPAIDDAVMAMLERDRERRFAGAHPALEALLATASARGGLEL